MVITIRHEERKDFRRVEEIIREAFWNLYCPGCNEHFIVHNMRKHPDFMPELTFVIERKGELLGSIFYTHSKVISRDGTEHKTVTFGPVGILPEFQRRGLGRALIEHSIIEAKKLGHRAIIIGGYPYHYKTYGFVGAKKYGISLPDGKYYSGIMALPLYEGALAEVCSSVHFSDALEPDESDLAEFDATFPPKIKQVQASQTEFEKAVNEIDIQEYVNSSN